MNILITGASKGVGFEIIKQFAKNPSNNIVALARDFEALHNLKDSCYKEYQNTIHIYSIDFLSNSFANGTASFNLLAISRPLLAFKP